MIKLLIVDDEEEIRTGIKEIIHWELYDISICDTAENGMEALKMIEEQEPDIILLDIKMPEIDGIKVMEILKSKKSRARTIIISGFDDFTYAQKAIALGASDYLLKPCHKDTVLKTVLRVKDIIEEEKHNQQMYERLKSQFNYSIPLLKEKYLSRLLNDEYEDIQKAKESFELYHVNLEMANLAIAVVSIDYPYHFHELFNAKDSDLMKFAIKNIADEILSPAYKLEMIELNDDIALYINLAPHETKTLLNMLEKVKSNIKNCLRFSVSIGLGSIQQDIRKINRSYLEAKKSVEAKFFLGSDRVIHYDEICSTEIEYTIYPINEEKSVLNCILKGNEDDVNTALNHFFASLNSNNFNKVHFTNCCITLSFSIFHLSIEKNINQDEIWVKSFSNLESLFKLDTLEETRNALINLAKSVMSQINSKKSSNRAIETAVSLMNENLMNDISLESISSSVYLSPSYFSLLFKQVMGINFVDYLNKIRIDRACELLRDIRYKTYEIAFKTGFKDEKYFSCIFKKLTGMTTTQFRANL